MILLASLLALVPHAGSVSLSTVHVERSAAVLELRAQVASFLEVLPQLDGDGDGRVDADELAAVRRDVAAYVAEHLSAAANAADDLSGGTRLAPQLDASSAELWTDERAVVPLLRDWIEVRLTWSLPGGSAAAPGSIQTLAFGSELFRRTSPDHIAYVTVAFRDGPEGTLRLTPEDPRARFDPQGRVPWLAYLRGGARDFAQRPAAWAGLWLLALGVALAARDRSSLLLWALISVAAAAAAVAFTESGRWDAYARRRDVAGGFGLALAYLGIDRLAFRAPRSAWVEALLVALFDGLLWGGVLARELRDEWSPRPAFSAFALGHTLAALALLAAAAALLRVLPSRSHRSLARLSWAAAAAWGLWLFLAGLR